MAQNPTKLLQALGIECVDEEIECTSTEPESYLKIQAYVPEHSVGHRHVVTHRRAIEPTNSLGT